MASVSQDQTPEESRDRRSAERAWDQTARGSTPIEDAFFRGLGRPRPSVEEPEVRDDGIGIDGR